MKNKLHLKTMAVVLTIAMFGSIFLGMGYFPPEALATGGVSGNWSDNSAAVENTDYTIAGDTYTIKTNIGLAWMAANFNGKIVELDNDINMEEHYWDLDLGTFAGIFDGKGYKISGLNIGSEASPTTGQQGLFSTVSEDAVVKNLGIESAKIMGGEFTTAGILAGTNSGIILSCYSKGEVKCETGTTKVGGLVGENRGKIANSYSTAVVSGGSQTPDKPGSLAGGLVGYNNEGTIANCYASGNVSIGDGIDVNLNVGGLIGASSGGIVLNSYAAGNVTGGMRSFIGGFAGMLQVGSGTAANCYWQSREGLQGTAMGPGPTTATTAADLTSQEFLATLNSNVDDIDIDGITLARWKTNDDDYPGLIPLPPFQGAGTEESPYIIHQAEDLEWMSSNYAANNAFLGQYFIQDADIDMSSVPAFTPIGDQSWPFSGTYNGGGYTIFNMSIDFEDVSEAGLFGNIGPGGKIESLTLIDISFHTDCVGPNIGGIAGWNQGIIEDCHIKASANNESLIYGSGNEVAAGGIAGTNVGTISKCSNAATIQVGGADDTGGSYYAGGITGLNFASINHSFNTGSIKNTDKTPETIALGGIVGGHLSPNSVCFTYNIGDIDLDADLEDLDKIHFKGGIIGYGSDATCVTNSFYLETPDLNAFNYANDNDETVSPSTGQASENTLKIAATFDGWDTDKWILADGNLPHLQSLVFKAVTYNGNGCTGGTVPTDNKSYRQGETVTVLGDTGGLTKSGYTFAGWNSQADGAGTDYAADATFAIGDASVMLYAKWTVGSSPGSDGGGSGFSGRAPANNVAITVGNQTQPQAAVMSIQNQGGQTVATVALDTQKMSQIVNSSPIGSTVTVPVSNPAATVIINRLDGGLVKTMESQQSIVEIRTNSAIYPVPAQQISIDAISAQLGQNLNLSDITIDIEIANTSNEMIKVVENSAVKETFSIVVPPLDFSIKATYQDRTVQINQFNAYVERYVAIPDGVDSSRITTAIITEPNGVVRHVPTQVIRIDGKYYAKINSLTNSTYSVIWHPLEFADVTEHWAKDAINDMGSRMVISGVGDGIFEPNRDITRAEFAAIMVRALGLKPGMGNNPFSDVKNSDWFSDYVTTAVDYKLISGYGNGLFGATDKITREQAMTMIARAMAITELKADLATGEVDDLLASFKDADQSSDYAKQGLAACTKFQIVSGRDGNLIAPQDYITRAEVAAIVQRLLKKSNLI